MGTKGDSSPSNQPYSIKPRCYVLYCTAGDTQHGWTIPLPCTRLVPKLGLVAFARFNRWRGRHEVRTKNLDNALRVLRSSCGVRARYHGYVLRDLAGTLPKVDNGRNLQNWNLVLPVCAHFSGNQPCARGGYRRPVNSSLHSNFLNTQAKARSTCTFTICHRLAHWL